MLLLDGPSIICHHLKVIDATGILLESQHMILWRTDGNYAIKLLSSLLQRFHGYGDVHLMTAYLIYKSGVCGFTLHERVLVLDILIRYFG